ncbi:uncharacterized protein KY384_007391 [Bacidia gigantensis]|uniref:uncharacterized protein n=1 Tax=Bacidia gigantensis TaxID=2732470 RepID=UPI001D0518AD|nr:uncharacterized protein KY384_007391 [Bacidia gigantensis]KAG8528473.1 hypothetical protein KY384_007391 [Bacidia gigantensis]
MVLEALAALSLATSVVQFVDFTSKLLSKGNKYYESPDGVLTENAELQGNVEHFKRLNIDLNNSLASVAAPHALDSAERALWTVTKECEKIAKEFCSTLDKLKLVGSRTRWRSFRQALKTLCSKERIQNMLQRLRSARENLIVHLLVVINFDKELVIQSNRGLESKILAAVQHSSGQLRQDVADLSKSILKEQHDKRKETVDSWIDDHRHQFGEVSQTVSTVVWHEREEWTGNSILRSLYFPRIKERYKRVAVAHAKTFDWIFEPPSDALVPWADFKLWLRDLAYQGSLYWVTGKPGSGKSTLMKYLYNDPRTRDSLRWWTNPFEPIIASSFFWNPGTPIQRSLHGLLQSLLHEILSQRVDLIKVAVPWRWQAYETTLESVSEWTDLELLDALSRLVEPSINTARFFFLIDGLDEFEGNDIARSEIVELFTNLSKYEHVKVCVSSRPWPIFEDAFEGQPSLLLQHLTHNDIVSYVKAKFEENKKFKRLMSKDAVGCTRLEMAVVQKSAGVFLRVYLVVQSLLEGFRNDDDAIDLKRRLDELPSDLEEYFAQIIGTLEPFYIRQAARLLQVALNAESLSLMAYSFMMEKDPEFAVKANITIFAPEDIDDRSTSATRRLKSRCKELLEAHQVSNLDDYFFEIEIGFLHRTVKDFLQTNLVRTMLEPHLDDSFDVNMNDKGLKIVMDKLDEVLIFRFNETKSSAQPMDCRFDKENHWTNYQLLEVDKPDLLCGRSFLSFAIAAGLHRYAQETLMIDTSLVKLKQGRPLLDCALRPMSGEDRRISARISVAQSEPIVDTIDLMIVQGANPNEAYFFQYRTSESQGTGYSEDTIWSLFVAHVRTSLASEDAAKIPSSWSKATELLINAGACRYLVPLSAKGFIKRARKSMMTRLNIWPRIGGVASDSDTDTSSIESDATSTDYDIASEGSDTQQAVESSECLGTDTLAMLSSVFGQEDIRKFEKAFASRATPGG